MLVLMVFCLGFGVVFCFLIDTAILGSPELQFMNSQGQQP